MSDICREMEKGLHKFKSNLDNLIKWINLTKDGVIITDEEKNIFFINATFERLSEFKAEEIIGKTPEAIIKSGQNPSRLYEEMWKEIDRSNSWAGGVINQKKSGELFYADISITKIVDENMVYYVGIYRDITNLWRDNQTITHTANHDTLTNLLTNDHFQKTIQKLLDNEKDNDETSFLLFFDLNGFKPINDSLGHVIGNQLLKAFADRLKDRFQEFGILGRFGGDEFLSFIPHAESKEEIVRKIHFFNKELSENPVKIDSRTFPISASVGIAQFPKDGREVSELIKKADTAMYQAKRSEKSLVEFYEPES